MGHVARHRKCVFFARARQADVCWGPCPAAPEKRERWTRRQRLQTRVHPGLSKVANSNRVVRGDLRDKKDAAKTGIAGSFCLSLRCRLFGDLVDEALPHRTGSNTTQSRALRRGSLLARLRSGASNGTFLQTYRASAPQLAVQHLYSATPFLAHIS